MLLSTSASLRDDDVHVGRQQRRFPHLERWQTVIAAIIGAVGAIAAVVIPIAINNNASPGTHSNTASSDSSDPGNRLAIDSISFGGVPPNVRIDVQGTYQKQSGDGYLFAMAKRANRTPSVWLVSDPVVPNKKGHWIAHILIGNSSPPMTVLAVLAGGCPPDVLCGPSLQAVAQDLQAGGPDRADYSTQPVTAQ